MKYARIVNDTVIETFVPHSGATIEECFTPDLVAQFIICPDEVEPRWIHKDGVFFIPVDLAAVETIIDVEEVIEQPTVE
jgi:hypothetical protein